MSLFSLKWMQHVTPGFTAKTSLIRQIPQKGIWCEKFASKPGFVASQRLNNQLWTVLIHKQNHVKSSGYRSQLDVILIKERDGRHRWALVTNNRSLAIHISSDSFECNDNALIWIDTVWSLLLQYNTLLSSVK